MMLLLVYSVNIPSWLLWKVLNDVTLFLYSPRIVEGCSPFLAWLISVWKPEKDRLGMQPMWPIFVWGCLLDLRLHSNIMAWFFIIVLLQQVVQYSALVPDIACSTLWTTGDGDTDCCSVYFSGSVYSFISFSSEIQYPFIFFLDYILVIMAEYFSRRWYLCITA